MCLWDQLCPVGSEMRSCWKYAIHVVFRGLCLLSQDIKHSGHLKALKGLNPAWLSLEG